MHNTGLLVILSLLLILLLLLPGPDLLSLSEELILRLHRNKMVGTTITMIWLN